MKAMSNHQDVIARLRERGVRAKDLSSLCRIMRLKLLYGQRVHLASISLGLERGVTVQVDEESSVSFGHLVYVRKGTDIQAHGSGIIQIGNRVYFGKNCTLVARAQIRIGNECLFGEDVSIYDHNHRHSARGVPFREQGYDCKPVTIGNNVWVGAKVFIRLGVTIGDNVIIGAGAVITKDVPSDTIAFTRVTTEMRHLDRVEGNAPRPDDHRL
jgi:acetyltransferase-like isoleucine patch superfamily enzyme